ncbi:4-hydroxybutyrate--acetyl-CoA CoA transferase [Pseudoflavonifractor phocaeensis]|uniref:acetyl-CoA hydrolase/transferase family protein n=1 Tax=Pseudoflavonifractor phocaeensis TaxID=1870988 RepID=UPI00195B4243|nr:acetyl-CoA hydrolase/transferase C-terminal domain-containing protein [Pseudoflavonifractor phocaeensis]MBM6869380.1 4-hydroxybutyrate--acetyl-CoA CoA transferase [Pseudoflavonifractor phocaeensis]MBM6939356.1 4-hydroxybutyrate--acetyl-CoA CoA transferase [Pseudoflavonifractor phocaeensis]
MDRWNTMYQEKLRTPQEIALEFKSGDICLSNGQITEPVGMLDALAQRAQAEDLRDLRHYLLLPMREQRYMAAEMAPHIRHISHFVSGFDREAIWEGRADYLPSHYSQVPVLWREVLEGPDVFYCTVAPMDKHGYFSCGTAADLSEIRKKAKKLLLEVNPTMPRTLGSQIHITEVTALMENDTPITTVPAAPISQNDTLIGGMIAQEIPDGATLQLGIGGIPNAVAQALTGKKDLGVHSEMFCDSIAQLTLAGVITNDRKNIHRGKTVVTFTFGTRETYDFLDDNPAVEFLPVDYVNDPRVIAQNDNVISINSCMEVDLFGQVCSETIGPKNFSGAGGQVDFIRGASASKGGKSFLAFQSSAKKGTISKIKPMLTPGSCVTTTRSDVDYLVTEYGMVRLKGLTCSQRAKALISIAHPNFREELTREAKNMHLIV